jgi:hypothetical protein
MESKTHALARAEHRAVELEGLHAACTVREGVMRGYESGIG